MKSPYKLSKELSISSTAIYKKIKQLENELEPHIEKKNGKILLTDEAETILRNSFSEVIEPVVEQLDNQLYNQLDKFYNQLNDENEYLRNQNTMLLEILEKERDHSRQQAQSLAELSEKLAELTKNGQILLLKQDQENTLLLSDERPEENKKSLWQWLFKKKNKA
ncbi:MAG: HTH domain-containing protein [Firmicutes bacterium]|nr:HTH domain-containing protein [Bacillota bacterium]